MASNDLAQRVAARIRSSTRALARRWLDALVELIPEEARDVFPTAKLLDHVPASEGDGDRPTVQRIGTVAAIRDVMRELEDMAEARRVELRVEGEIGEIEVDRGRFELALLNLISNGIKYSDPRKPTREVRGEATPDRAA